MDVTSLGWRTDIAILEASGSTVTDCGTHLLVTTADNPTYHWGNFLLLKELPVAGGAREVMGAFDTWFRTNRHRAIGIDATTDVDVSEFEQAGMSKTVSHVMTAERLVEPERPFTGGGIRPITSDEWGKWVDLELAAHPDDRAWARPYVEGRARQEQRLVAAGRGYRWGAFVDGRLAASAGLFDLGDGVFRFQSVATHPRRRNQGIASTLLHRMGRWAVEQQGARQLVLVADPDGPAIATYRRLGLETVELAVELEQTLPGEIA